MSTERGLVHPIETSNDAAVDELLAIRCQLGEADALNALVERWHQSLWKYIRRMTGDDDAAAETLQDVWLRVLRAMPALRDPARLREWLFGIARRVVMDGLRKKYAEPELAAEDLEEIAGPDDAGESAEDLSLMYEALGRLPSGEREVLVLFYLQELSLSQLAVVLAVPIGTVKSRLFRARRLMRRELTGRD